MTDDFLTKTQMSEEDKQMVDEFISFIGRSLYTVIAKYEEMTGKPFTVVNDADMMMLSELTHQSIDVALMTLNALADAAILDKKNRFKVIKPNQETK